MIERQMPQDILQYKKKFINNFSARECFFGVISVGIIIYLYFFVCTPEVSTVFDNTTIRALTCALPAAPFFCIGFITIYGVTFEKVAIPIVIDNFLYQRHRHYELHYEELEQRQRSRSYIKSTNSKQPKITCKPSKKYKGF